MTSHRLLNVGCGRHFHPAWTNIDIAPIGDPVLRHDVLEVLPFSDESFDVVYHSHVLEHLPRTAAPAFIAECRRVLVTGGVLRVVVPDLETICRLYLRTLEGALAGEDGAADRYEWMVVELLDQLVREESGGEMLRFWMRRPVPAEDFVVERVGAIARDFIDRQRRRPPAPAAKPDPPKPETIGAFRLSGEVHKWMYDRYSLARLLSAAGFVSPQLHQATTSAIPGFRDFGLDTEPDGRTRKPDSLFMEAIKSR